MKKEHFTDALIRAIKPSDKVEEYFDSDKIINDKVRSHGESSLILRVNPGGSKSFVVCYWIDGKSMRMTLGKYPGLSLSEARNRAKNIKHQVKNGVNPKIKKEKVEVCEYLLSDLINDFITNHVEKKLKGSTQKSYLSRLNKIRNEFPGTNKSITSISREEVRDYLKEISLKTQIQANRIHSIMSSVFSYAVEEGKLNLNPIYKMKKLNQETPSDVHYKNDEIKRLWCAIESEPLVLSSLLKVLLFTGRRVGEVCKAKWEHIDFKEKNWRFPDANVKSKLGDNLPLTDNLLELLEKLKRDGTSEYIFTSPKNNEQYYSNTKKLTNRIRKKSGIENFKIHHLRHTVATRMASLSVPQQIIGKVLNHKTLSGGNEITARYINSTYDKEKLAAMKLWHDKLEKIINGVS
jgi:integrase